MAELKNLFLDQLKKMHVNKHVEQAKRQLKQVWRYSVFF